MMLHISYNEQFCPIFLASPWYSESLPATQKCHPSHQWLGVFGIPCTCLYQIQK